MNIDHPERDAMMMEHLTRVSSKDCPDPRHPVLQKEYEAADPPKTLPRLKLEDMPDWWDPKRPPIRLHEGWIYIGKDGVWRHPSGRLASRTERRRAKVKNGSQD